MSKNQKWTIAIKPDSVSPARKVTKIIGLSDGFSVITPYHTVQQGYLCKMPVDPAKKHYQVPFDDCEGYIVEKRAKLSYHSDGFVQFSSMKSGEVISGRDSKGNPKGCALMSHPFSSPIWTGPSATVAFWGLQEFELLSSSDKNVLIFKQEDLSYLDCDWGSGNSWILEIWIFKLSIIPFCHWQGDLLTYEMPVQLKSGLVVPKRYIILPLLNQDIYLGIVMDSTIVNFPPDSGWILGGAGDWTSTKKGHVLKGIYPRDFLPVSGLPTLDYQPLDSVPN